MAKEDENWRESGRQYRGVGQRMKDMADIKTGLTGTAQMVVGSNDAAPRVGSGMIPVLATPVMINLIEEAALAAVEHLLPKGKQSLGTHLDVSHIAATPVGMGATATATLVKIDGRTLEFEVIARDEKDVIGQGRHTRVVVTADKFLERVRAKAGK